MLSISSSAKGDGAAGYFFNSATEDYYVGKEQSAGYWSGKGAAALNLEGGVTRKEFVNLLQGFSPDGKEKLVQNAGHPNRQPGLDLTNSAVKSFSVLYGLSKGPGRAKLKDIHRRANQAQIDYLQDVAGFSRIGKGGHTLVQASFVIASFFEETSRANDMNVHTHNFLLNAGFCSDGKFRALWTEELFRHKMAAGKVYRDELARLVQEELGLVIEPRKVGFHIQGVPQELCDINSKRRAQIVKSLAERGLTSAVAAKIAALETRPQKQNVPQSELQAYWTRVGEEFGFGPAQAEALLLEGQQRIEMRKAVAHESKQRQSKDEGAQSSGSSHSDRQEEKSHQDAGRAQGTNREHNHQKSSDHAKNSGRTNRTSQYAKQSSRSFAKGKAKLIPRIKKQLLFPYAPEWSPFKYWKTAHVEVDTGKEFRRWGKIKWSKNLGVAEIRIQRKYIFPNASASNPLHKATFPSLRVLSPSQQRKMQAKKAHFQKIEERMSH